jgi:hypothetical protein
MGSFSGPDFIKALSSPQGIPLVSNLLAFTGMARAKEPVGGSASTFDFSPGFGCRVWIPVPVALVDKVEHFGKVTCKDHEHDYVRVHLTNPTTEEGKLLASLVGPSLGDHISGVTPSAQPGPLGHASVQSFGFHGIHGIHPPPVGGPIVIPNPILQSQCATCIAINLGLGLEVAAAVATLGPAIGVSTAVSSLMARFGISEAAAIVAVGGASGANIARMMCKTAC